MESKSFWMFDRKEITPKIRTTEESIEDEIPPPPPQIIKNVVK